MEVELTPQMYKALVEARNLAMHNALAARVPECGDFAKIAQDLDYIVAYLHEIEQKCKLTIDKS